MNILMISTDRGLFDENSAVRQRIVEYGGLVNELHIIVFTKSGFEEQNFNNVFLYPTNSQSKWSYINDAVKIGIEKIKNKDKEFVISTQDPFEAGLAGYRIAKKIKAPLHLQIHTDFLSPYFVRYSALNKVRVIIAKFLIKRAKSIRVVSERIKKSLNTKKNITVLPIFIDIEKIRKESQVKIDLHQKYPQFDFIILMASRFTKEKNIKMAIKTMKEVIKKNSKVGLVLIGEGPEKKNYESRIKNYKLENNVKIESWTDDLTSYYKTADLFLLTSNYEGYGRTVVEAMASSTLIAMTDVGLAGDIIKDGYSGFVFSVGDTAKLEEIILKAVKDNIHNLLVVSASNTLDSLPSKEEYLKKYKESWESCLS